MGQKFAMYNKKMEIIGLYDSVDSPIPDHATDVIEISDEQYWTLLAGQSAGKRMAVDQSLAPALLDPPAPTREQVATEKRALRDMALKATDWLVARHQDEKLIGDGTTLAYGQFTELLRYRQALRDIGSADGWPYIDLPAAPEYLVAHREAMG